jgi:hypothetical protein
MGFRVHLIAIRGKTPEAVRQELGVTPTGEREEISESSITAATLPDGAYLLYFNDPAQFDPDDKLYRRLSKGASLVACFAHEGIMISYACGWSDGVEQWFVIHNSQERADHHLKTRGNLPQQFQSIRERLFVEQETKADADYIFDSPVELFAAAGGVRYDSDIPGAGPEPWEVLESS